MTRNSAIDAYDRSARAYADSYESLSTEQILPGLRELLSPRKLSVLDIGAGSGRDAAWLSEQGCDVVAVEPAKKLLAEAKARHIGKPIEWVSDSLPELARIRELGYRFDFILLSAVWMHVLPEQRRSAFDSIMQLLKPDGNVLFTLRHGPSPIDRPMFPVSISELESLASRHLGVAKKLSDQASQDQLGRQSIWWEQVLAILPAGQHNQLELLRQIIVNDSKSSTYKIGLLSAVERVGRQSLHLAHSPNELEVDIPLGAVALDWLRTYRGLNCAGLRQTTNGKVKSVPNIESSKLKIGADLNEDESTELHQALLACARTISECPVRFMKRAGGSGPQLFKIIKGAGRLLGPAETPISESYLRQFGELRMPRVLWETMLQNSELIRAALLDEWVRLSTLYNRRAVETSEIKRLTE